MPTNTHIIPDDYPVALHGVSTVKAVGNGIIEGYLVPFSSEDQRDLHGEFFDRNTNFHIDDFPPLTAKCMYHHALDDTLSVRNIGKFIKAVIDDAGIWVQAQLDLRSEYEKYIYEMAKSGKLGWSSGALPQSVQIDPNGHIKSWAIIEGSLTPSPAMPYQTQVSPLKTLPRTALREAVEPEEAAPVGDVTGDTNSTKFEPPTGELKAMTPEEVRALIMGILQELGLTPPVDPTMPSPEMEAMQTVAAAVPPEELLKMTDPEEQKAFAAKLAKAGFDVMNARHQKATTLANDAVDAARRAAPGKSQTAQAGLVTNSNSNISVSEELKYAHLTAADMAAGYILLQTSMNPNKLKGLPPTSFVSEGYFKTMAHKAAAEVQKSPYKDVRDNNTVKAAFPWKVNELDASNIVTQGAEWVGVYYSTELWEKVRYEPMYEKIIGQMMNREIGQNGSAVFPLESDDPTVFTRRQANNTDVTGRPEVTVQITPFETGSVTVTPGELAAATAITEILEEDSFIDVGRQANAQLMSTAKEYVEMALFNGDTATAANTNINLIDGTPANGNLNKPYYLVQNGIIKQALVTAPAASVTTALDLSNTLTASSFLSIFGLFDRKIRSRKDKVVFVIDPDVEQKMRAFPELLTYAAAGGNATIYTGDIPNLFGVQTMVSGFIERANTAGKISETAGNNVRGRILAIYPPNWGWAWKRNITIETQRDILSGSTVYVLSMRFALVPRSYDAAVIGYNAAI